MNLFRGTIKVVMGLALVLVLTLGVAQKATAQNVTMPLTPRLSLVGDDGSYDKVFYPDGRLWLPTAAGEPREFLLPVFINNNWYNYYKDDKTRKKYIPNDISSFKFSLLYDSKTLRAVGVETVAPDYLDMLPEDILARKFNFDCADIKDNHYWYYIDSLHWKSTNEKEDGRRFTIVGTSTEPLPTTEGASRGRQNYQVLLFVRFKVIAELKLGQKPDMISKKPLYIDNREIRYNDMDVTKDRPTVEMSDYDVEEAKTDYPGAPTKNIVGVTNEETTFFNTEPYKNGSIAVHFFDKLPAFELSTILLDNPVLDLYKINNGDPKYLGMYALAKSITIDSNCTTPKYAEVKVRLNNKETGTRMIFPTVRSNTDWLMFKSDISLGGNYIAQYTNFSKGEIPYIDNGILGSTDPLGADTEEQQPHYLSVVADPDKLVKNDPTDLEKAGQYDGYLTFSAPYAFTNPVRLYVTFDYIRNPYEPEFNKSATGATGGVNLTMINSAGNYGDSVKMVFGTGIRATEFVDRLFGEEAYTSGLSKTALDARFYPTYNIDLNQYPGLKPLYDNGFRDIAPNTYEPRTNSRDIRPFTKDAGTYTYHVKFNSGGADKYPCVLEWDLSDFPKDAQIYLKDAENGKLFPAVDMRKANQLTPTKRSYTFQDARITEFYIEYTLPSSFEFVDDKGNSAITQGWNMLSLPIRPLNNSYKEVYPNAINIPYKFTMNQHQEVDNGLLYPGQGYFIKYSQEIDYLFKGRFFTEIKYVAGDPESDQIKVYPSDDFDDSNPIKNELGAWNMVGALSVPTSAAGIYFSAYKSGSLAPDEKFTKKFGVWQYYPKQGYKEVQMLQPGYGYWIKTDKLGYYNLKVAIGKQSVSATDEKEIALENSCKLTITDNAQNNACLYLANDKNIDDRYFEMPPVPPTGIFDVRFNDNKYLATSEETFVKLQGVKYPVVLTVNNADADYTFVDAITGINLGSVSQGFTGNVVIDRLSADVIKVAKQSIDTEKEGLSVRPNPIVNTSVINYNVSKDANVTIKLYDAIGNELMTLVDGQLAKGSYTTNLNANGLNAGTYICKMTAGDVNSVVRVTVVK